MLLENCELTQQQYITTYLLERLKSKTWQYQIHSYMFRIKNYRQIAYNCSVQTSEPLRRGWRRSLVRKSIFLWKLKKNSLYLGNKSSYGMYLVIELGREYTHNFFPLIWKVANRYCWDTKSHKFSNLLLTKLSEGNKANHSEHKMWRCKLCGCVKWPKWH